MIRAQIITRWVPHPSMAWFAPAIWINIPQAPGDAWTDVTAQPAANLPTAPNVVVIEVTVNAATFAAILAHPDYGPGAVLWSETISG